MISSMIDSQPNIVYTVESIARDYPTISRELLAGLVRYGQADQIPSPLLEEMVQRDIAAQEVAADNSWYGTVKGISRNLFLGAEDLYNVSPLLAMPRLGINLYQGKSVEEATNLAFASSLRNELRASRAGIATTYGDGFMASQELIPQGVDFWTRVREAIINGDYEGSADEQIVAAQQAALKQQLLETGMNPYAMARQEWLSTQISRTINGENMAVPFSPGASIAIWYTTPGTFAYDAFSGSLDAIARMTLEPIDVAFDNVGQVFRHFNPAVFSDNVAGINRGGKIWQDMLADMGIYHPKQPMLQSINQVDDAGHVIKNPILGSTDTRGISAEGVATINVDPKEITRIWERGIDDLSTKSGTQWADPTNPYVKPYADRGLTPNDVRKAIAVQGGENGQYFLTLEHELVHGELQQKWFRLFDEFDGSDTKYIDHAHVFDDAPEELKSIARELQEKKLSIDDFEGPNGYKQRWQVAREQAEAADEAVIDLKDQLKNGVGDPGQRSLLQRDLKEALKLSKRTRANADELAAMYDDLLEQRKVLDNQADEFTEAHAVSEAWDRMQSGKWAAPELYSEWKRKAGLSKLLRPWLNPKAATEWLQSNMGRRTVEALARADTFDYVRKHAKYLSPQEMALVTRSTDPGEVAEIIRKAINKHPGELRPTIGLIQDQLSYGLDGLRIKTAFIGGPVAAAHKQMGRTLRRAKAGVGANTMSVTDMDATLDTIYSVAATAGASADEISELQIKATQIGTMKSGLDEIYNDLKDISIRELKARSGDIYSDDEIMKIWKEWEGYQEQARQFWTSNKGRERKVVFRQGKYELLSNIDETTIQSQAFMEAQFAMATRTMPDIRRIRRLHSKQRNAWERVRARRQALPGGSDYYTPLGFNKSALMGVGDFSFGIWRDMQLMRGGWALRIIPEEQLRFGASGYSGLFKNPIDYFISLMNRMDFPQPGVEMSLGDIMRMEESLGTAGLRDLRMPAHVVSHEDWGIASLARQPELFWAAFTREFLLNTHDRVVTRVAAVGREEALAFFRTAEGQAVVREIAAGASKNSPLALIANPKELASMIDVVDLRIAQISGGDGIWFDPLKKAWVDLNDNVIHQIPDVPGGHYPNKQSIADEIIKRTGNPNALAGQSKATRGQLKELLNEVRGYDLDELEATKRAAFVTQEGNADIRTFIHTRKLDDITITDDMPFGAVREIDSQLEAAFASRGVKTPEYWPVPANEMESGSVGLYNKAVDTFFEWFNAVPSKTLNRQPFFNQAYGARLALDYFYGTSEFRKAMDMKAASNQDFAQTLAVGRRKVFRDKGVTKNPPPFERVDDYEWDPVRQLGEPGGGELYDEAIQSGLYDRMPLANDPEAFVSQAIFDALEQLSVEADATKARGTYTTTSQFPITNDPNDPLWTAYPGLAFSGTNRQPIEEWMKTDWQWGSPSVGNAVITQATGKAPIPGDNVKLIHHINSLPLEEAITREGLLTAGVTPSVVDDLLADADVMDRLANMRALGNPNTTPEQLRTAALAFGWRDVHRTGGIAHSPTRAYTYGQYTDVFRTDHLPDYAREHLVREGDIEHLLTVEGGRYPALAKVDGFTEAYRTVRKETGLFGRTRRQTGTVADIQIHGERATRQRIEHHLGRSLDSEEAMEFSRLFQTNASSWKLTVGQSGIEPAARLPSDLVVALNERGLMVSSNRQVGDVALLLDQNTEAAIARSVFDDVVIPKEEIAESTIGWRKGFVNTGDDNARRRDMWWEWSTLGNDIYNDAVERATSAYEATAWKVIPMRLLRNTSEGPELPVDIGSWLTNPTFRAKSYQLLDEIHAIEERADRFMWAFQESDEVQAAIGAPAYGPMPPYPDNEELANLINEIVTAEYYEDMIRYGSHYDGGGTTTDSGEFFAFDATQRAETLHYYATTGMGIGEDIKAVRIRTQGVIDTYEDFATRVLQKHSGANRLDGEVWDGFNLGGLKPKEETVEALNRGDNLNLNFDGVPNDERNAAVQRMFGRIDNQQYDKGYELGPVRGHSEVPLTVQEELDVAMKTAKYEAIEETKEIFYDLANKSNVADAYKFIFPFGDAWYEVLSRWAHIMNPVESGGQPLRNVRRVQQTFNAGRQSGFISTNEYGEEVFNWPIAPGMMSNTFIPNESNVKLQASMPISSLMFIDPSARGVGMPGTSPIWQLSVQFTAPYTEGIPLFHDTLQWMTYGDKSQYRPGEIDELDDVMQGFVPTVMNRIASWMFDEQARETLGTTKLRLFQSLGMSGDPNFDMMTQEGGRRAWDTANAAGSWLAMFRIMDAWMMPGQPQYSVEFDTPDPLASIPDFTFEEFLEQVGQLDWRQQTPVLSAVRLAAEYRHARELFGDAEADLYMIQRHGVLPAMLQSASSGLVERPVSWGGIDHVNDNLWLKDIAPYTLAATVPADADDTFSSSAWNNLFTEFLMVDGVENRAIRSKRSPSEFLQAIQRSVGYDQLRYQQALFDQAVGQLRSSYGENYSSNADYRWKKKQLDRTLRDNKDSIYTEFGIVRGSNQGAIIGSVEGVTVRMMVDEVIRLGLPGTNENTKFREEMPHLADVAETYSGWFRELEMISRMMDEGAASSEWWINGESDQAEFLRKAVASASQRYFSQLTNPDQIAYAKWLNDRILSDLLQDWEWIDRSFAPELKSFPSVWKASTLSINPVEVTP